MLNFGNKEFRNLQEQVLKNAQDIETLKGRENLHIAIVNELPEVGNANYIYLLAKDDGESPDVYDEYIWLEDEERYELIGGVTIDLTNYATLDTQQTFTGEKSFNAPIVFNAVVYGGNIYLAAALNFYDDVSISKGSDTNLVFTLAGDGKSMRPNWDGHYDIGTSGYKWRDGYFGGNVFASEFRGSYFGTSGNAAYMKGSLFAPDQSGTKNLGTASLYWNNLYLVGNISDGANTVSVANISSKVTSTQASGTFDANGESTIDISGGTPEGLFIFTYGNCECFVRLTATMVQNADVTPIRVACPMITSGSPYLGWLEIERSANTLTISVKDGNIHVDSGFAWTLTKTNLL